MRFIAIAFFLIASTALAQAGSVTIRSTDGKNQAAVKAASTAAATTDPALVVAISPNNNIPVTQSGAWTVAATESGTWTVQPGNTANTTPWLMKLNDGTTSFTVKAASTAAGASDTAVVVAISPNNSVAVTGTFWQTTQPVSFGGNGTVIAFQTSVTTSAAALATNTSKTLCVQASTANTDLVYLGPSGVTTSTGYALYPGSTYCTNVSNSNLIFAISNSGTQTLTSIGTN